jgi:hypothetical protein
MVLQSLTVRPVIILSSGVDLILVSVSVRLDTMNLGLHATLAITRATIVQGELNSSVSTATMWLHLEIGGVAIRNVTALPDILIQEPWHNAKCAIGHA